MKWAAVNEQVPLLKTNPVLMPNCFCQIALPLSMRPFSVNLCLEHWVGKRISDIHRSEVKGRSRKEDLIMHEIVVQTSQREVMVDITAQVQDFVRCREYDHGLLILFCPHTTAGLTINEAADSTVARDILTTLRRLVPRQGDYWHAEGNSDAHVKAGMTGADQRVLVQEGRLLLGMWQGIFLAEFDGPRTRRLWAQWFAANTSH